MVGRGSDPVGGLVVGQSSGRSLGSVDPTHFSGQVPIFQVRCPFCRSGAHISGQVPIFQVPVFQVRCPFFRSGAHFSGRVPSLPAGGVSKKASFSERSLHLWGLPGPYPRAFGSTHQRGLWWALAVATRYVE